MADLEQEALDRIAHSTKADDLRRIARNARGKSERVEKAALKRIVTIESKGEFGSVAFDCWTMVLAVEEVRRQLRGRKAPMNRLRPKIAREGERAALEYLALHESEGFREVLEYDMPEYAAESIVVRHGQPTFSDKAILKARQRLTNAGFDPDELAE